MSWYVAPSLATLRAEINARWPGRDRASDGSIGDAAHQASKSDHNPNSRGSVNAIDVDADGVDFPVVLAAIVRHPSARYVIYERRLYHRLRGWRAEPYSGTNPHVGHFHISIDQTRTAEQDRRPWGLLEDDMSEKASRLIEAWAVGKTATTARETVEPVKWRIRDEAWQKRVDGLLVALAAAVEGLDMDAVLRRLDEHAQAEAERDAELAELVQQAKSGELDAAEFVRIVGEKLATQAA